MPSKFEYAFEMDTSAFGWKLKLYAKFRYAMEENCEM